MFFARQQPLNNFFDQTSWQATLNANMSTTKASSSNWRYSKIYSRIADFNIAERDTFRDLMQMFYLAQTHGFDYYGPPPPFNFPLPDGFEFAFFEQVFHDWNSAEQPRRIPMLEARQPADVYVNVGTLKNDVPEAESIGGRGENATTEPIPTRRAKGATVYLQVVVEPITDTADFIFVDLRGGYIPRNVVEFDPELPLPMVQEHALKRYNGFETLWVTTYNKALAIAIAQRRIIEIAKNRNNLANINFKELDAAYPEFKFLKLAEPSLPRPAERFRQVAGMRPSH